jgi:hypothetical protein
VNIAKLPELAFARHHAPTAGQISICDSKRCLSRALAALVGPLQTLVSTVQHHCLSHQALPQTVQTGIPPALVLKRHTARQVRIHSSFGPSSEIARRPRVAVNIAKLTELLRAQADSGTAQAQQ